MGACARTLRGGGGHPRDPRGEAGGTPATPGTAPTGYDGGAVMPS